jgi:hypothetical protein
VNQLCSNAQARLERIDVPAPPGVAFSLVKKLLAFNDAEHQRVEVVLLSRNDPVSGMRVFRSCQAHGLPSVQRGVFTQGRDPFRYLRPLGAHLFLSANEYGRALGPAPGLPGGARAHRVGAGGRRPSARGTHRL